MGLRASHLVSACVFSPRTSSFSPADILHTAKPPSSTLTVLRVHLLLVSPTHFSKRASSPFLLICGTRKPACQKQSDAHDGPHLPIRPRITSPSSSRTAEPPSQPVHRTNGVHLRARARPNTQGFRACVSLIPILALSCFFAFSFAHHPPPTAAYVLVWCRVSSFLGQHISAYAHAPPAVPFRFSRRVCARFARKPRETKERDL